jgi:hypothetical protein
MVNERTTELNPTESGWKKEGIFDEPRLSEVTELYREIGMEVLVAPVALAEMDGCTECMKTDLSRFKTVYTKKLRQ